MIWYDGYEQAIGKCVTAKEQTYRSYLQEETCYVYKISGTNSSQESISFIILIYFQTHYAPFQTAGIHEKKGLQNW